MFNKDNALESSFKEGDGASSSAQAAALKLSEEANFAKGPDQRLALNSVREQQSAAALDQLRAGVTFVETVTTVTDTVFSLFGVGAGDTKAKAGKPISQERLADGSTVSKFSDGHKTTQSPNGTVRTDYPDGHFVVHKPDGKGGYREVHDGNARPEANFVLVKKDGKFRLDDPLGFGVIDGHESFGERSSFAQSLDKLAEQKIKDPEQLSRFRADMLRFEEAMVSRDLGAIEMMGVYQQIDRLLSDTKKEPLSQAERVHLACDLISQLASPSSIEKGTNGSNAGFEREKRTYIDRPETAARLLVDLALAGEYEDRYGNKTRIRPDQLSFDEQAKSFSLSAANKPGARSYASQLFQLALDAKHLEG